MQTVPLRPGRGARLSFLGGRKKEMPQQQQQQKPAALMRGERGHVGETGSREGESNGRSTGTHSRSISRAQSHEDQRPGLGITGSASNGTHSNGPVSRSGTEASEWMTDSGSHASHDTPVDSLETKERESMGGVGAPRLGGMKKRLSMLRLGKKTGKGNGDMGALDEE